jgi:hypothetical protein
MVIRNEILNGALLQSHKSCGLRLVNFKGNIIRLETRRGYPVAYFAKDASIHEIRNTANNWMMETDLISYAGLK